MSAVGDLRLLDCQPQEGCPEADAPDVGCGPKTSVARPGELRKELTLAHCPEADVSGAGSQGIQIADWTLASTLLDRFEQGEVEYPTDAEKLIAELLRAFGHAVFDTGFIESERGADLFLEAMIDGAKRRIAVEVKYRGQAAERGSIAQLLAMRESHQVDRVLVVSRSGFTAEALRLAKENGVGLVDLLSPAESRL